MVPVSSSGSVLEPSWNPSHCELVIKIFPRIWDLIMHLHAVQAGSVLWGPQVHISLVGQTRKREEIAEKSTQYEVYPAKDGKFGANPLYSTNPSLF